MPLRKIKPDKTVKNATKQGTKSTNKLSFNEQYELANLPKKIENMEAEKFSLEKIIADTEFYKQDPTTIKETLGKLKNLETTVAIAYKRWDELEQKSNKNS